MSGLSIDSTDHKIMTRHDYPKTVLELEQRFATSGPAVHHSRGARDVAPLQPRASFAGLEDELR